MASTIFDVPILLPGLKLKPTDSSAKVSNDVKTPIPRQVFIMQQWTGNFALLREKRVYLLVTYKSKVYPNPSTNEEELEDMPFIVDMETEYLEKPQADVAERYFSFDLDFKRFWTSPEEIAQIELTFYTSEHGTQQSVAIGEPFVIDFTDEENPASNGVLPNGQLFLDWDLNSSLLREISSPADIETLKSESVIRDDVLLLGISGGKNYDPSKPLVLNVRLHDFLGSGHSQLKLKFRGDATIDLDVNKSLDDAIEKAFESRMRMFEDSALDRPVSSSGVFEGYLKFEIDPKSIQRILEDCEKSLIYVMIEDSRSNSCVAKFLISSIASNDLYFDSAAGMVKVPENRAWDKITHWSDILMRTSQAGWDQILPEAAYKSTRIESQPLNSPDNALQKFCVEIVLPQIDDELTNFKVDADDITLLVESCDSNLVFKDNEKSRFLYMKNAVEVISNSEDCNTIKFEWIAFNRGVVERNAEMKVSVLVDDRLAEIGENRPKKIGQTVSIIKEVGGASKHHVSNLKLRNAVSMGLEAASDIERSFFHFMETSFKIAYVFSVEEKLSNSVFTFLGKAADDITSKFYKILTKKGDSEIYEQIVKSEVFCARDIDSIKEIEDSEVAQVIEEIFVWLARKDHVELMLDWANSMTLDEDALDLAKDGKDMNGLLETVVENFRRVLKMNSRELILQLQKHPDLKIDFVTAGQMVRDDIENTLPETFVSSTEGVYETLSAAGLNMSKCDFAKVFNEPGLVELEATMLKTVHNIEQDLSATSLSPEEASISRVDEANLSDMKSNLMGMLETAAEGGEFCISFLNNSKDALDTVISPLSELDNFIATVDDLANNARNMYRIANNFNNVMTTLGRIARGPLTPLKVIVRAISFPMKLVLNALKKGENLMTGLKRKVGSKLKKLVNRAKRNRIESVSGNLDNSSTAIEQFVEIIDMMITLASMGVVPMSLISKFASSSSLAGFFTTVKNSLNTLKSGVEGLLNQVEVLQPQIATFRRLNNNIRSKMTLLSPVDFLLNKLRPFTAVIDRVYRMFPRWARWAINKAFSPIDRAINLILGPFSNLLNALVRRLDPFGGIDRALGSFIRPLDLLPLDTWLDQTLGELDSFGNSSKFDNVKVTFTHGAAIIIRCIYGSMSNLFLQGANSVKFFEEMMGGANSDGFKAMKMLLDGKRGASPNITMSDMIRIVKMETVDRHLAKCDSYLRMNASDQPYTYKDSASYKLQSYMRRPFELAYCDVDPSRDKKSALFKYGRHNRLWITSSIASHLHFATITEQAEDIGDIISSSDRVVLPFLPVDKGRGHCTVSLYPKITSSMRTYNIDTRLPIKQTKLRIETEVEKMPKAILDYATERILSEVDPDFSEIYSWALVEKVFICKLGVPKDWVESVGTAFHLLSGNRLGACFTNDREFFRMHWANQFGTSSSRQYDTVQLDNSLGPLMPEVMLNHMKRNTMSMKEVDLLASLHRMERDDRKSDDVSTVKEAMKNLSMYVVKLFSNAVYPVLYRDDTANGNLVIAHSGGFIQPLMDLSDVLEVWEYQITSSGNSHKTINIALTPIAEQEVTPYILTPADTAEATKPSLSRTVSTKPDTGTEDAILIDRFFPGMPDPPDLRMVDAVQGVRQTTRRLARRRIRTIRRLDYVKYGVGPGRLLHIGKVESVDYVTNRHNRRVRTNFRVRELSHTRDRIRHHIIQKGPRIKRLTDEEKQSYPAILQDYGVFNRRPNRLIQDIATRRARQWSTNAIENKRKVPYWGLSFANFKKYVEHCRRHSPVLWSECESKVDNVVKQGPKGFVSVDDLNKAFIKPNTSGLRSSIALNMMDIARPPNVSKSQVLISHAWREDVLQVIDLLENAKRTGTVLKSGGVFGDSTIVWFCAFALYQSGTDAEGPTEAAQLGIEPFKQITQAVKDMFVLQTSICDPYSKLWCVSELSIALALEPDNMQIHPLFSTEWAQKYVRYVNVDIESVWEPIDGKMMYIQRTKEAVGEPTVLTRKITYRDIQDPNNRGNEGAKTYYLMNENETVKETIDGDENPVLRFSVMRGLTEFGVHEGTRKADGDEFRRLDLLPGEWMRMQNIIVRFQHNAARDFYHEMFPALSPPS